MQHLACLLADSLFRVSVPSCLAAACRTHVPCATSVKLAVWAADDVLAVTGNLAAEGSLALQLLPGTSAAGLCAASASPRLVDGHAAYRAHGGAQQCRGMCRCTLHVPIGGHPATGDAVSAQCAYGCLVVAFRCGQLHSMHGYIQLLTALATALADVLPSAAALLSQNLAAVLNTQPQAAPKAKRTAAWLQHDAAASEWGKAVSHLEGQALKQAAASTADMEAANNAAFDSGDGSNSDKTSESDSRAGSDSEAGTDDSISALAGASDTELEPFLDLNFCAQQMQLDAGRSPTDSSPPATPPSLPSPFATPSPPSEAGGRSAEQAAAGAPAGMPLGSPRDRGDASSGGGSRNDAGGDDGSQGGDSSGEDIAGLKAALHGQHGGPPGPAAAGQPARTADAAAYLQWHAASSYNLDVAVLVLLLINVVSKGARPPAWLFWTMPLPSLTFATVNTACLLLALLGSSWYKRRQAAMLALWAALVFISVSYACRAPTLEYSEPGALAKPLWAARAFALETTMVGPVAMRLPYGVAMPVVLLHFVCAAVTAPHVCAASVFMGLSRRRCTATAWILQAAFCLALPLLMCRWLDARSRRVYHVQAQPAGVT